MNNPTSCTTPTQTLKKKCSDCKNHLAVSFFSKDRRSEDGLQGWCKKCMSDYHKAIKAGIRRAKPQNTRFWDRVEKTESCWMWRGQVSSDGYGRFSFGKNGQLAHRFSWTIHYGNIPDGLLVCHHCDVPGCVNPEHLFLGTWKDNNLDMAAKGRHGQSRKTHCPSGHAYSAENTAVTVGERRCRECMKASKKRARQRARDNKLVPAGLR